MQHDEDEEDRSNDDGGDDRAAVPGPVVRPLVLLRVWIHGASFPLLVGVISRRPHASRRVTTINPAAAIPIP
jgi:hypothetical protein